MSPLAFERRDGQGHRVCFPGTPAFHERCSLPVRQSSAIYPIGASMPEIEDFLALSLPPPVMAVLVFIVAYLLVDIPLSFLRNEQPHSTWWATWAGVFAGLLYIVFVVAVYPDMDREVTHASSPVQHAPHRSLANAPASSGR